MEKGIPVYDDVEDLVDLRSVWVGLRRRAGLFASVAATTFLAVVAYTFLTPERYTAETALMIEPKKEVFAFGEDVFAQAPADPQMVSSEVEFMRQRGMAIRVVKRMRANDRLNAVDVVAADMEPRSGEGYLVEKFSEAAVNLASLSQTASAEDGEVVEAALPVSDDGSHSATTGEKRTKDISNVHVEDDPALKDVAARIPEEKISGDELREILSYLEVQQVGSTFLIKIRYSAETPELAAKVANAYAEEYLLGQLEYQFEDLRQADTFIEGRITVLRDEVRIAEEAAAAFRAKEGLVDTATGQSLTEQRIAALTAELAKEKSRLATLTSRYNIVRGYLSSNVPLDSIGEVMSSAVIMELRRQQAEIIRRRAELKVRYGDLHPELKKINEESAELQAQINREVGRIVASLRAEVNFATAQVSSIEQSILDLQGDLVVNNSAQVRLAELERDAQASRGVYESLLNRQKELNERDQLAEANARIVAIAEPPDNPSMPRKKLLLAGGLMLALLMGGGTSFAAEMLDTRIKNTNDIRKEFGQGAPVVLAPRIQSRLLFRQRQGDEVARKYILEEPSSSFAEAMRDLRMHLKAAEGDVNGAVSIAFTSAFKGEGKSTTAFAFATLLANSGKRVAFVDCAAGTTEFMESDHKSESDGEFPFLKVEDASDDNSDPRFASLPDNTATTGELDRNGEVAIAPARDHSAGRAIANSGQVSMTIKSRKCGVAMAEFSGLPMHPHDEFDYKAFDKAIDGARSDYDYLIIDAPPLLTKSEASMIAGAADFAVMITEWCSTTRGAARVGVQRLMDARARILSFVITKVDEKQRFYFRPEDRHFYYRRSH